MNSTSRNTGCPAMLSVRPSSCIGLQSLPHVEPEPGESAGRGQSSSSWDPARSCRWYFGALDPELQLFVALVDSLVNPTLVPRMLAGSRRRCNQAPGGRCAVPILRTRNRVRRDRCKRLASVPPSSDGCIVVTLSQYKPEQGQEQL